MRDLEEPDVGICAGERSLNGAKCINKSHSALASILIQQFKKKKKKLKRICFLVQSILLTCCSISCLFIYLFNILLIFHLIQPFGTNFPSHFTQRFTHFSCFLIIYTFLKLVFNLTEQIITHSPPKVVSCQKFLILIFF